MLTFAPETRVTCGASELQVFVRVTETSVDVTPLWKDEHTGRIALPNWGAAGQ